MCVDAINHLCFLSFEGHRWALSKQILRERWRWFVCKWKKMRKVETEREGSFPMQPKQRPEHTLRECCVSMAVQGRWEYNGQDRIQTSGGLNQSDHHRFTYLNTCSPVGGAVWETLWDVAFLEEVWLWGRLFLVSFPCLQAVDQDVSSQLFLCSTFVDSNPLKL